MMKYDCQIIATEQALAYLTINSSYLSDLSLFHGKMGIALFFFELARASQNVAYEGLASNLLDEIKGMEKRTMTFQTHVAVKLHYL